MLPTSSRTRKRRLAGLMASLLLLMQFAMAAQACMLAPAVSAGASQQAMSEAECDGTPMDGAACRVRCFAQDQTAASLDQHFHAVPASAHIVSAIFTLPAIRSASPPLSVSRLPVGPPLQILYCSYQI